MRYARQALPLLPFLAVVLVFLIIPTGTVIVNAFVVDGRFSLELIGALFTRHRWPPWRAAWRSRRAVR